MAPEIISEPETIPIETPADPTTLEELAQTGTQKEFAAVRQGGKSVQEVVAAREPVGESGSPDAISEAGKTLAAHKSGLERRKASLQAEINAIVREREDNKRLSQREKDQMRAEIDALKAERAELAPARAPKTESAPVAVAGATATADLEPTAGQFETYEQYVKAQARWEARQEITAVMKATREQNMRVHGERTQQEALKRTYEAGLTAHSDFEQVLDEAKVAGVRWSPMLSQAVSFHPLGHELAYALAKDPTESARLSAIQHPVIFGVELGKKLALLQAAHSGPASKVVSISQAPAPIKPVDAGGTSSSPSLQQIAESGDMKRFRAARMASR